MLILLLGFHSKKHNSHQSMLIGTESMIANHFNLQVWLQKAYFHAILAKAATANWPFRNYFTKVRKMGVYIHAKFVRLYNKVRYLRNEEICYSIIKWGNSSQVLVSNITWLYCSLKKNFWNLNVKHFCVWFLARLQIRPLKLYKREILYQVYFSKCWVFYKVFH